MSQTKKEFAAKGKDGIQQHIADYAFSISYETIPQEAIRAAKARVIDTVGVLIGGFFGEPCRIGRDVAALMPDPGGATIIGTRMKTTPDVAAFVNGTTARYTDMNDNYNWPGSAHGHPSDALMAIFSAAEHAHGTGRDLIAAVVLGYEVFLRISDVFRSRNFDTSNFACLASAVAACKLFGLTPAATAHGISMAVVPNNILKQVRSGDKSMFKGAATGQAGRAGVFAAMLARAGMEGPHLPFEGKAGWCDHVAGDRFSLDAWGEGATPYKILDSRIKLRPANASAIATILAAERVAPLSNVDNVERVTVEVHQYAKDGVGSGEWPWHPDTREIADHSIPYVVASTLLDGTVTVRSYSDTRRWDPRLRGLLPRIEVVANETFTRAYNSLPVQELARVTVLLRNGERLTGESGGDDDDLSASKSDAQIADKFASQTDEYFGARRSQAILERLWHLEDVDDVGAIPRTLVLA